MKLKKILYPDGTSLNLVGRYSRGRYMARVLESTQPAIFIDERDADALSRWALTKEFGPIDSLFWILERAHESLMAGLTPSDWSLTTNR